MGKLIDSEVLKHYTNRQMLSWKLGSLCHLMRSWISSILCQYVISQHGLLWIKWHLILWCHMAQVLLNSFATILLNWGVILVMVDWHFGISFLYFPDWICEKVTVMLYQDSKSIQNVNCIRNYQVNVCK